MRISTNITASLSENTENLSVSNNIESLVSGNPLITPTSFVVDYTDIKSWEIDNAQGAAFSLDILDLINVMMANLGGNVKSIHIQCGKKIDSRRETRESCRFTITTNQGIMGTMGQLTLADISNFNYSELTLSNIIVPEGRLGVLTIVVGANK